jgi:hypothetical protein
MVENLSESLEVESKVINVTDEVIDIRSDHGRENEKKAMKTTGKIRKIVRPQSGKPKGIRYEGGLKDSQSNSNIRIERM